jgi:hypothetical protein
MIGFKKYIESKYGIKFEDYESKFSDEERHKDLEEYLKTRLFSHRLLS